MRIAARRSAEFLTRTRNGKASDVVVQPERRRVRRDVMADRESASPRTRRHKYTGKGGLNVDVGRGTFR